MNAGLGGQMRSGWLQSQGRGAAGNDKQKERRGEMMRMQKEKGCSRFEAAKDPIERK